LLDCKADVDVKPTDDGSTPLYIGTFGVQQS